MFDIQPGGSTALPSWLTIVDESNVAHKRKLPTCPPSYGKLKERNVLEVDSVVTAKKR